MRAWGEVWGGGRLGACRGKGTLDSLQGLIWDQTISK